MKRKQKSEEYIDENTDENEMNLGFNADTADSGLVSNAPNTNVAEDTTVVGISGDASKPWIACPLAYIFRDDLEFVEDKSGLICRNIFSFLPWSNHKSIRKVSQKFWRYSYAVDPRMSIQHYFSRNNKEVVGRLWDEFRDRLVPDFQEIFRKSCSIGHLGIVTYLLSEPGVVKRDDCVTGLSIAAGSGHLDVVKKVARVGGIPLSENCNDALQRACRHGRLDVVNYLLEHNSVRKHLKQNGKPLTDASRGGHMAVIKSIFGVSEKYNLQISPSVSDLEAVCEHGHLEVLKMLFPLYKCIDEAEEEDSMQEAYDFYNCMTNAASKNHADIMKFLIDNSRHSYPFGGTKIVEEACFYKSVDVLLVLLAHPKIKRIIGRVFTHVATVVCKKNNVVLLKELLRCKGGKYPAQYKKNFLIKSAANHNARAVMECLVLEYKVDPWVNNNYVLLKACNTNNVAMLKFLLTKSGCLIETWTQDNKALEDACAQGHLKIVKMIMKHNEKCGHKSDPQMNRAFRVACRCGHLEVIQYILETYPRIDVNYYEFLSEDLCEKGKYNVLEFLISNKNFVVARNGHKDLQLAIANGHGKIVMFFLSMVNKYPITNMYTLISTACEHGQYTIMETLLSHPSTNLTRKESNALIKKAKARKMPQMASIIDRYTNFPLEKKRTTTKNGEKAKN